MTSLTLTKKCLTGGVWEGTLTGETADTPNLALRHNDETISGITVEDIAGGTWSVQVPVPADLINDDVQTFVIVDETSDTILNSFTVFAGEQMSDALQVELDLLRAELDILKRAFRKHCVETT